MSLFCKYCPCQATLSSGTIVAVKQLFIKGGHSIDNFCNEVVLITEMKHRNLVKLLGCCLHGNQQLLVYEFVENCDLHQALLGTCSMMIHWMTNTWFFWTWTNYDYEMNLYPWAHECLIWVSSCVIICRTKVWWDDLGYTPQDLPWCCTWPSLLARVGKAQNHSPRH